MSSKRILQNACKKKYRVFIHARNLLIPDSDHGSKGAGLFTTVYVEAEDVSAAKQGAIVALRHDEQFVSCVPRHAEHQMTLLVEDIEEIGSFTGCRLPREPFVFYYGSEEEA